MDSGISGESRYFKKLSLSVFEEMKNFAQVTST